MSLTLSACSNSKLIVGPLYNRLDDQIRSEFTKLGDDFSTEQTRAFEQALGTFHVWHRQSELPQYAQLLSEIANTITEPEQATAQTQYWIDSLHQFFRSTRECYPAYFLIGTIQTLSDEQLGHIQRRFRKERYKNREKYRKRTPEERVDYRLERIDTWTSRMKLTLNAQQKALLRNNLRQHISLREQYYSLMETWSRKFFALARNQQNPNYETQVKEHMLAYWNLLEEAHPQEQQANRELWHRSTEQLVNSLTTEQRRKTSQWLKKMSKTLDAVSKDKPSFNVGKDPRVGCLVK